MSKYNKLWAGIGGYVVGIGFGYAAWAGLAQCTDVALLETCTLFGMNQAAVTNLLGGIVGAIFIERSAPNTK